MGAVLVRAGHARRAAYIKPDEQAAPQAPIRNRLPECNAGIAQLVEQLICNQQVIGSNPIAGSLLESFVDKGFRVVALS